MLRLRPTPVSGLGSRLPVGARCLSALVSADVARIIIAEVVADDAIKRRFATASISRSNSTGSRQRLPVTQLEHDELVPMALGYVHAWLAEDYWTILSASSRSADQSG